MMIDRITITPETDKLQTDAADLAEMLYDRVTEYLNHDIADMYPLAVKQRARWMLARMLTGERSRCFLLPSLEDV